MPVFSLIFFLCQLKMFKTRNLS